jgi:hypothetical protein
MLVRVVFAAALALAIGAPQLARAGCTEELSQLMSRDTEKLTTRFNKISKRIQEQGGSAKLRAEECKVARQLKPKLESQLAALKQSGCLKDPEVGGMIADIVRGHEDDLAEASKSTARSECR